MHGTFPLVMNHPLYNEVMELSRISKIPIELSIGDFTMEEFGYTKGDSKGIEIVIRPDAINDIAVLIHELLHAKMRLLDYPNLYLYNGFKFPPVIESTITSLHNSIQHIFVFREMERLGVSQSY